MHITDIKTDDDGLEVVRGKGRSLARMANAGFNVPAGFLVKTSAYRSFIADNNLQVMIPSTVSDIFFTANPATGERSELLTETALEIEKLYDGLPQDIEWAFSAVGSGTKLSLLQSRKAAVATNEPTATKPLTKESGEV